MYTTFLERTCTYGSIRTSMVLVDEYDLLGRWILWENEACVPHSREEEEEGHT